MTSPSFVSVAFLAREMGLDRNTVQRALDVDGLVRTPRGYDRDLGLAAVALHADPARVAGHASLGRGNHEAKTSDYAAARAQSESERTRKLKIGNDREEGALVRRDDVVKQTRDLAAKARQSLMVLGTRLSSKLLGIKDPRVIKITIDDEVRTVLDDFADGLAA